jgi:hypothetical protein
MKRKLTLVFCAAGSIAVFGVAAAPGTAFGNTCERRSTSSLFHYSSEAACEYRPIPGFIEMWLPSGGEWILKQAAAWKAAGITVTGPTSLSEKATSGTYVFKFELGSSKIKTTCTEATVHSGNLEAEGTLTIDVHLSECTVNEPSNCTVEQPINIGTIKGELGSSSKAEFYPDEGEVFTDLTYTGSSCAVKGSYPVRDGQACKLDSKIETEEKIHSMTCGASEGDLRVGCGSAAFESTAIDLVLEGEKIYRTEGV